MTYNEHQDYEHHAKEVGNCIDLLGRYAIALDASLNVLDIGAGQGMHAGPLAEYFNKVYCTDIIDYSSLYDGAFCKLLADKYARVGKPLRLDRVAFLETDARALVFKDSTFDVVLSINAFEHIPDTTRALAEAVRVTKPGGHLLISFDPIWTADTGSHFFHRVPEPWGHLVRTPEQYGHLMRDAGATEGEVAEFRSAMNRNRYTHYLDAFTQAEREGTMTTVHFDCWAGVTDERHRTHPNYQPCHEAGYSDEELLLRGMRWLLRRER